MMESQIINSQKIRLFKRKDIDKKKWDACILNSKNSRHFAMSWFLDIVSPNWGALIYNDYKAIMPIPFLRRFKFNFILQPSFCQQLGIFSENELNSDLLREFFNCLKNLFPFLYNVNLLNAPPNMQVYKTELLPNYELKLNRDFSSIKSKFSKNTIRNLTKANNLNLILKKTKPEDDILDFLFTYSKAGYSKNKKIILRKIIQHSFLRKEGYLLTCSDIDGDILAVGFFILHKNRITFTASASSPNGYKKHATFCIFEKIIMENSNSELSLDFEGSKNDGISRFFKGFGSEINEYGQIKSISFSISILLILKKIKDFF